MAVLQPSPRSPGNGYLIEERRFPFSNSSQLFLASFLSLYFEVLVIRYLTSEVRVFANLKNFLLIASFFGIVLGIMLRASTKSPRRALLLIVILLFLPIRFASQLHLPSVDISWNYELSVGSVNLFWRALCALRLLAVVYFLRLIVALFVVLGGFVGENLKHVSPLKGYGINLAGSLLGMALVATLSFLDSGPAIWPLVSFIFLLPFSFASTSRSRYLWSLSLRLQYRSRALFGRRTIGSISPQFLRRKAHPILPPIRLWPIIRGINGW
jgi:hypothetical protein